MIPRAIKKDIGRIFMQDEVQKYLKDISRFTQEHIFRPRQVPRLESPKLVFMTDEQLNKAKLAAHDEVKVRLQMPPVMSANIKEPKVYSKDEEIVGYSKFKIMFVDISSGFTDRSRLMSVRETDGTLREPNFDERTRLNHMFYPGDSRSLDVPKIFSDEHLYRVLKRKDYIYVLDRACVQFEPDDPRYVEVTKKVYDYIDDKRDFNKLRSTRHFGPMSLHLAYNNKIDNLLCEMLSKDLIEDSTKLVKIYNLCHDKT